MRIGKGISLFFRWPIVLLVLLGVLITTMIFGVAIRVLEPDTFKTIYDGIWWAIVTTSSVGYGDLVPSTLPGRVMAVILILLGTGLATTYLAVISSGVISLQKSFREGKLKFAGIHHLLVVGWNERTNSTITELLSKNADMKIVLIDSSLKENPLNHKKVHFIKGNPAEPATLKNAKIETADIILITADQNKNESESDMHAIISLLAAKGLNPGIYSIVEILTPHQVKNARQAGADEIIQSNILSGNIMMSSISTSGTGELLVKLAEEIKSGSLKFMDVHFDLQGKTINEARQKLTGENIVLLGIKRGEAINVNPSPQLILEMTDMLIIMSC